MRVEDRMADDLIAFANDMDRCWLERRFGDLMNFIAGDVVMVAPGGKVRMEGADAAIESYREFMQRCDVRRFRADGHMVTRRGPAAVVEYDWHMAWTDQGVDQQASGRDILVLALRDDGWRVVWRTQLPA